MKIFNWIPTAVMIIAVLSTSGCSYRKQKGPPDSSDGADAPVGDASGEKAPGGSSSLKASGGPGYERIKNQVLAPKCLGCHSGADAAGGVRFETYAQTQASLGGIQSAVLSAQPTMPKGQPPLSQVEQSLLRDWIARGAPELSTDGQGSSVFQTWASISAKVLEPRCVECHSQPNPVKDFDATSLIEVRSKVVLILDHVLVRKDMPRDAPLSTDEMQALTQWIFEGMPE